MLKNEIKLVFTDVDSTLIVKPGVFTDEIISAMKHCNEKDVEFVMCSGTPTSTLIKYSEKLKKEGIELNYVSGYNGAEIYNLNTKEAEYKSFLGHSDIDVITKVLEDNELSFIAYNNDEVFISNFDSDGIKRNVIKNKFNKFTDISDIKETPKILAVTDNNNANKIAKKLSAILNDYNVVNSDDTYIEITKQGVNKKMGVTAVSNILNISLSDVIVCGDSHNDLAMFDTEAYGIAVGNATQDIKDVADIIVDSVEFDGVAKYLINNL